LITGFIYNKIFIIEVYFIPRGGHHRPAPLLVAAPGRAVLDAGQVATHAGTLSTKNR